MKTADFWRATRYHRRVQRGKGRRPAISLAIFRWRCSRSLTRITIDAALALKPLAQFG